VDDSAATEQLALPGLDDRPAGPLTQLEQAMRRSIAALELCLALARAVGRATDKGQAAAAAMAAAQLREAWQLLPEPGGAAAGDQWDQLARELREASELERQRHAQALGQ
jgi:hypothetical protein